MKKNKDNTKGSTQPSKMVPIAVCKIWFIISIPLLLITALPLGILAWVMDICCGKIFDRRARIKVEDGKSISFHHFGEVKIIFKGNGQLETGFYCCYKSRYPSQTRQQMLAITSSSIHFDLLVGKTITSRLDIAYMISCIIFVAVYLSRLFSHAYAFEIGNIASEYFFSYDYVVAPIVGVGGFQVKFSPTKQTKIFFEMSTIKTITIQKES